MKRSFIILSAALILLSACTLLPAATPISPTPLPPTPTSLPSLQTRIGDQQLILDQLKVQGKAIVIPMQIQANITLGMDGKFTGKGGCNNFFGTYESTFPGEVKFSAIGASKMYCQDKMEVESGLFQVLDKATRYIVDNFRLILQSEDGEYLARFYVPVK